MTDFTEKPVSYTVNTGHVKCPDHLYLFDEGTGTNAADQGAVGGLDITLTDAAMRTTADLTAGGDMSPVIQCDNSPDYHGNSATGLSVTSALCVVALVKPDSATNPAATETCVSAAVSSNTTEFLHCRFGTNGRLNAVYDDTVIAQINRESDATDFYDAAWHLVAVKAYESGSDVLIRASVDGAAWSAATTGTGTTLPAFDRIAVGAHAGLYSVNEFHGQVAAVFVYLDDSASWDDTWIAAVYNAGDPWQFLSTAAPALTLKLLAEASAASAASIEGVVLNSTRDTVIGEFSGQAFEAALEGGEAVLLVPVTDITPDGSMLTVSDTPLVFAYNATQSIIGPGSATVIEV